MGLARWRSAFSIRSVSHEGLTFGSHVLCSAMYFKADASHNFQVSEDITLKPRLVLRKALLCFECDLFHTKLIFRSRGDWCSETLFNSWGCFCAGFRSHWADTFPYNLKVSQQEASMSNAHKEKRRGKRSHEPGNNSSTIPPLTVTWPISFHQVQSYRMRVWYILLAKISFGAFLFQPKAYFLVTFPHSLIK